MERCIQLAQLGAGNVAPNPMVGAVLVHEDKIIGEGYHKKYGEPHAEVNCLNSVAGKNKLLIKSSTMYVSLEPCAHYGKTPPCADLIIKNKIPGVVIGVMDIYKEVAGEGIKRLKEAGIKVVTGMLEEKCRELNKRFFTFHQFRRPYIILKWAQSVNGKIGSGTGDRMLISNEYSNRLVHKWRSEEAAILVGTNTAIQDDPSLTTRLWKGNNPVRIIIDNALKLPQSLKVFGTGSKTIIFNLLKNYQKENLQFIKMNADNYLNEMLQSLYQLNIQSILVEGGAKTLQSFIDAGFWDEARIITNENLFAENGITAPKLNNAAPVSEQRFFSDAIRYYRNLQ